MPRATEDNKSDRDFWEGERLIAEEIRREQQPDNRPNIVGLIVVATVVFWFGFIVGALLL